MYVCNYVIMCTVNTSGIQSAARGPLATRHAEVCSSAEDLFFTSLMITNILHYITVLQCWNTAVRKHLKVKMALIAKKVEGHWYIRMYICTYVCKYERICIYVKVVCTGRKWISN